MSAMLAMIVECTAEGRARAIVTATNPVTAPGTTRASRELERLA